MRTSFQSLGSGRSLLTGGWSLIIFRAKSSPVSSESKPQNTSYPLASTFPSHARRTGRDAGGRNGGAPWMKNVDRYGVYGRFAEDHFPAFARVDDEGAETFPGAGRHAPPLRRARAVQLRADHFGVFSQHREDGVVLAVGVKASGFQKGVNGLEGNATPRAEVLLYSRQVDVASWGRAKDELGRRSKIISHFRPSVYSSSQEKSCVL